MRLPIFWKILNTALEHRLLTVTCVNNDQIPFLGYVSRYILSKFDQKGFEKDTCPFHRQTRPGVTRDPIRCPKGKLKPAKKQRLSTEYPVASPTNSSAPPTLPDERELDRESGEQQHSKFRPEIEAHQDFTKRLLAGIFYADDPMGKYLRDKEGIVFADASCFASRNLWLQVTKLFILFSLHKTN